MCAEKPRSNSDSFGSRASAGTPRRPAREAGQVARIGRPRTGRRAGRRTAERTPAAPGRYGPESTNSCGAVHVEGGAGPGASSTSTCALAPPAPNALTPGARRPPDGPATAVRTCCTRNGESSQVEICGLIRSECSDGTRSPVPHLKQHLGESGDAGRALQVPDVRLHGPDRRTCARARRARTPAAARRSRWGRRATYRCRAPRGSRRSPGPSRPGPARRRISVGLRHRTRHGEAARAAGVVAAGRGDDAVHVVAVGQRAVERLEHSGADALARHVAGAAVAEAPASAVGRQELSLRELQVLLRVDRDVHAAGERHRRTRPGRRLSHREVHGGQRRRARGVDGQARARAGRGSTTPGSRPTACIAVGATPVGRRSTSW